MPGDTAHRPGAARGCHRVKRLSVPTVHGAEPGLHAAGHPPPGALRHRAIAPSRPAAATVLLDNTPHLAAPCARRNRGNRHALAAALALTIGVGDALACTRVLWSDNGYATMAGRSMDWPTTTEPLLYLMPRGMARDGGLAGGETAVADNPARWTSRYGSAITSVYGVGAADGVNEAGLAAHLLYLNAADYGPRDPAKPGLQAGLWVQYLLDNAATVAEAVALMDRVQIVMIEAHGHKATVHVAVEDAAGDSAIFEYVEGKLVVHHDREHTVMTNDPVFSEQLKIFAAHDFRKPDSSVPIPGNVNPKDRFARSHYFLNLLPDPKSEREAAASMLSVMRNVSVPFGAPYKGFGIYNTEYRTAINLKDRRYYFELTNSPNTVWVDLAAVNLEAGAPVRMLDPDDVRLAGNVTGAFAPVAAPF